jgi:glycosyltransferase involved in cell wall biosynthesis
MTNYQHWHGIDDTRYGYGRHTRGFVDNAPKTVKFDPKASVNLWMCVPWMNKGWFKGQYRACFTMYETDKLPRRFEQYLPLYDLIVVPCEHNLELFSKYHKNVVKVQEGVDSTLFKPTDTPRLERFQFRAGGSLWLRKGLDVVVEAFLRLSLPDADLRIKAAPHAHDTPYFSPGPNIYLDRQWMTEAEQVEWFAQADCFVAASRGEGWGLMPLQTMAMGIPTILSLSTGHLEFSDLATGTVTCGKSPSTLCGQWDEPNVDDLAEQMLDHYRNWQAKKTQALAAVPTIRTKFSWKKAAKQLADALPLGEMLTKPVWQESTVGIKVRALRNVKADIGKHEYRQKAGDIFEVTDGAYEVLSDAGMVEYVHDD